MTPIAQQKSVWIHQFDQLGETTMAEIAGTMQRFTGARLALVKALDQDAWMASFDHDPLAIGSLAALRQRQAEGLAAGIDIVPWVVPAHPQNAAVHASCGPRLVVDAEPYAGFWQETPQAFVSYLQQLRAGGVSELAVSLDARRSAELALGVDGWAQLVGALLPQLYWTSFQQPAPVVLPLLQQLAGYGVPVVPVLPYDGAAADQAPERSATVGDFQMVWATARGLGCRGVSLWKLGPATIPQLEAFNALQLPATADQVAQLTQQLTAVTAECDQLRQTVAAIRQLVAPAS
jgi:hypothetical protein